MDINNLSDIITEFQGSKNYQWMIWGDKYYTSDNVDIMARRKLVYLPEMPKPIDHPYLANHKLPSGYLTKIVDQKVQYLLGNGVTVDKSNKAIIDELFGSTKNEDKFTSFVQDIATTASKKLVGWAYPYIDDEGKLKFVNVPPEEVIAFMDSKGVLQMVIRFYENTEIDETDNTLKTFNVAEVWTDMELTTYKKAADDSKAVYSKIETCGHMSKQVVNNLTGATEEKQEIGWGRIPFVPLYNNKDKTSDLKRIKPFIDIYDIVNSDFANNIDDMQEAFYILKNYGGEDMQEFVSQLKMLKAVPVGDNGDVDIKQLQIPTEARGTFLELTDKNIFKFGMAVDTTNLAGGSITNVVIKAMFADLDLKADKFQTQVLDFIEGIMWFINEYFKMTGKAEIAPELSFSRSLIINEVEILKANQEQKGNISEDTRLKNNPWVKDVDEEKKLIEKDQESAANFIDNNIDFQEDNQDVDIDPVE